MEKPRVLVIDDEVDMANEIGAMVKESNFETEVVYSGQAGIDKLKTKDFDVVLLDIRMPKMWGTEALQKIKKLGNPLEVIMLTALDDAKNAWKASTYGAFDYITKPFKKDDLIFRIALAAKRVKEKRILDKLNKSTQIFFRVYEKDRKAYDKIIEKFEKETGSNKSMGLQEIKEWFSEKKLKEIFGKNFNQDWIKPFGEFEQ